MRRLSPGVVLAFVCVLGLCGSIGNRMCDPVHTSAHADSRREGAELFATRGCAHCHGLNGDGTDSGPSLLKLRKKLKPQQIEDQIVHGGQAMPAFGDTLTHEEIESLVSFLRAKNWTPAPVHAEPAK